MNIFKIINHKALVYSIITIFCFGLVCISSCIGKKPVSQIPVVDSLLMQPAKADIDTEYYSMVEKNAIFQNGDINTFKTYLKKNVKYPANALKKKQQGSAVIQMGVDCYGSVKILSVLKSSGYPLIDNEIKRAIIASPKWIPAQNQGTKVGQLHMLTFIFRLKTRAVEIK